MTISPAFEASDDKHETSWWFDWRNFPIIIPIVFPFRRTKKF